ncbi:ribonuclease H-like domain-containing protein [Tanacetum coccineum]
MLFYMRSLYGLKQAPRAWFQRQGTDTAYLLLYVDDIVLTASSESLLQQILDHYIRSLKKYAIELLDRAHMDNCNSSRTSIDTESKLGGDVQQVCLYMHDPLEPHFSALKMILRYVRGTLDYGFQLFSSSTTNLVAYSDADWAGCPTTRKAEYRGVANVVADVTFLIFMSLHDSINDHNLF